jgi:NADPH:quinone reductase
MQAIGYRKASPALDALEAFELPKPTPEGRDLLVEVRAVSVNPVDYKVASGTAPEPGQTKVVGYDAAGAVAEAGPEARLFKPGDEVPAASAGRGRTRNISWSTSGSWARSRARSISPPPPLCR